MSCISLVVVIKMCINSEQLKLDWQCGYAARVLHCSASLHVSTANAV